MSGPVDPTERPDPPEGTERTSVASVDDTLLGSESRPSIVRGEADTGVGSDNPRYRIERVIGEGGMGSVLVCADRLIGRRVAMKMIRGDRDAAAAIEARFLREARVQGQLEHPAIAPVYDLGRDAEGAAYFTMKRIQGVTLADVIEGLASGDAAVVASFTLRRLLSAFSSVCLAVDFAHQRGVIHRDLKPANVMLGDFGEVYVLDWGVARLSGDPTDAPVERVRDVDDAPATRNEIAGTPGYMSPEQMTGGELTPASDVYALGVLLFELTTLERFHRERTLTRQLFAALEGVEARPSKRAPGLALPPELDVFCARATAPRIEDRYASARALQQAVEAYLDGERDLALRSELAKQHVAHASSALEAPERLSDPARRQALREIGRAIALDPDNRDATRALIRLLDSPPKENPPEVAAELDEELSRRRRAGLGFVVIFSVLLFVPLLAAGLWSGILRPWLFAALLGLTVVTLGWAERTRRRTHPSSNDALPNLVLATIVFAISGTLTGPFMLALTMITVNTFGTTMVIPTTRRWWPTVAALCGFGAPFAAQALGLIPRMYGFEDGRMIIYPVLLRFSAAPTMTFLVASAILLILASGTAANRIRVTIADAQNRMYMQRWQLSQLVPERDDQAGSARQR